MKHFIFFVHCLLYINLSVDVEGMYNSLDAAPGQFKSLARVEVTVPGQDGLVLGNGVLISTCHIITAASNVKINDQLATRIAIYLGSNIANENEVVRIVDIVNHVNIFVAQLYNEQYRPNNFAFVKFEPVPLSSTIAIAPLTPLSTLRTLTYVGQTVIVAGWGFTDDGTPSDRVKYSTYTAIPLPRCRTALNKTMTTSEVCLLANSNNSSPHYNTDDGGIAIIEGQGFIATVSFVSPDYKSGKPFSCLNMNWILRITETVTGIVY